MNIKYVEMESCNEVVKLVQVEAREDGIGLKYLSGNIPNWTPKGSNQFQAHITNMEILVKMGPIKC